LAGCLVGLAVGDALGAPLEFLPRDQVRKRFPQGLREMIASSLWNKGEYTDDTQMTLLIAESLLQNEGFVASDVAKRFQAWAKTAKDVGIQPRLWST
jgi:ADP-ribosylglycohydrolase